MTTAHFLSDHPIHCPLGLLAKAQQFKRACLLVVCANGPFPVASAFAALEAGIATPILVGEPDTIRRESDKLGWNLSDQAIIPAQGETGAATKAVEIIQQGGIDAVMKGQLHTDIFINALLRQEAGVRIGKRLVHIFAIYPPGVDSTPVLVSDAVVNVAPDIETRQQALIEMAALSRLLGIDRPKLAILSATESVLPSIPSSSEAAELAQWAQTEIPTADIAGPLSFDLAVSRDAAAIKHLDNDTLTGRVVGQADGLLVPDLVSGNILYKAMVYLAGGCAAGLVLGGSLPILLTSRADPPEARLASIALAAIVSAPISSSPTEDGTR